MTTDDQQPEPVSPLSEPRPCGPATPGESQVAFVAFRARVRCNLDPAGVVERRLADRVARLLWRLDRLGRYEEAVATRSVAATVLPPDPDSVVGNEVDLYRRGPPAGPLAARLAYARGWVRIREIQRPALESVVRALAGDDAASVDCRSAVVTRVMTDALGGGSDDVRRRWDQAVARLPADRLATAKEFRALVGALAANRMETAAIAAMVATAAANYDADGARHAAVEAEMAAEMRAAREAAAVAAVYDDGEAVERLTRLTRLEAHTTRQLDQVLALLARLRGDRPRAAGPGSVAAALRAGGQW